VACTDHAWSYLLHTCEPFEHIGFEGAHDGIVILLKRLLVFFGVRHFHVDHARLAVMRAEKIAGEKNAFFLAPGEHGIRPVEHGRNHELKRDPAKIEHFSILYRMRVELHVCDLTEVFKCSQGAEHLYIGVHIEEALQSAAVIGLGMIENQVIDFFEIRERGEILHIFLAEAAMHVFNKSALVVPLHVISIVGGAVFSLHNDVKYPHGGV
jgi:hypothetical protein